MKKGAVIAAIAMPAAAVLLLPVAGVVGLTVLVSSTGGSSSNAGSGCHGTAAVAGVELTDEQQANAAAITAAVEARNLPAQDAVIAVMTAITESSLVNVGHGDTAGPDSRGLFQQRDSWGSLEVRMDPTGATGLFLDALTSPELTVYGTDDLVNATATSRYEIAPWLVAQSVQRSAFADGSNYRTHYGQAVTIVTAAASSTTPLDLGGWDGVDLTGQPIADLVTGGSGGLDLSSLDCGSDLMAGGQQGPGAWGGYANGRIPLEVLAPIPWAPDQHARPDAVEALVALNAAFRAQFGKDIAITDSYRSFEDQVATKAAKGWLAAVPGTSNHGWGLALDLGSGINRFGTAEHAWMRAHAPAYGWIHPDWARQGGSKPEPWHWEYQATESAGGQA